MQKFQHLERLSFSEKYKFDNKKRTQALSVNSFYN